MPGWITLAFRLEKPLTLPSEEYGSWIHRMSTFESAVKLLCQQQLLQIFARLFERLLAPFDLTFVDL